MSQMHSNDSGLTFDLLDRLHKSLRLSGMSAKALAADLGVHRNTVNNYLSGKTPVDRRTLIAWALLTEVPLKWLEHGVVVEDPDPGEKLDTTAQVDAVAQLAHRKRSRTRRGTTERYLPSAA